MNDEKITVSRMDPAMAALLDARVTSETRGELAGLSREKLDELRRRHQRLYENRLRMASQGIRGVNVTETERLLSLWRRMEGKDASQLDADERVEVLDALAAGE